MSVYEKMTAIADKIRSYLQTDDLMTLDDMPTRIDEAVFNESDSMYWDGWDAGYFDGEATGFSNGQEEGFAQGEQAEYDRFWDEFQENGERASYTYAFYGAQGWTDETYNPKYAIAPLTCNQMFNANTKITDTKVTIDLTGANANITALFVNCNNLVTIRKLIVKESNKLSGSFNNCKALQNITFEGTIGRDINLQWSPLTLESALSVVNHLYNYTGESGADTYTITLNSSVWTLLDAWMQEQPVLGELYSTAREWIECELCWLTA